MAVKHVFRQLYRCRFEKNFRSRRNFFLELTIYFVSNRNRGKMILFNQNEFVSNIYISTKNNGKVSHKTCTEPHLIWIFWILCGKCRTYFLGSLKSAGLVPKKSAGFKSIAEIRRSSLLNTLNPRDPIWVKSKKLRKSQELVFEVRFYWYDSSHLGWLFMAIIIHICL